MNLAVDPFAPIMQDSGGTQSMSGGADLAKLIQQTMQTQMASWQGIVTSMVKDAVGQALEPIQKGLTENVELLRSVKAQLRAHGKKFDALSTRVDTLEVDVRNNNDSYLAEMSRIQLKLNKIEDRARIYNVRLINLTTGVEGDDPKGYLQKMLPKWIPTLKSSRNAVVAVDKAHRIFSNKKTGTRTMIFKLLHFSDRQAILEGARKAKPTLADGTKLLFFADYSPGTTKARRSFKDIRSKLWQMGIESFLVYPAVLKVNYKGKKMLFNSAEEATAAVDAFEEGDGAAAAAAMETEGDGGEEEDTGGPDA